MAAFRLLFYAPPLALSAIQFYDRRLDCRCVKKAVQPQSNEAAELTMKTPCLLNKLIDDNAAEQLKTRLNLSILPPQLAQLWETLNPGGPDQVEMIQGESFYIALTAASPNSKEGRFKASLVSCHPAEHPRKNRSWPRYYFDHERAKREIEAWMQYNGQFRLLCLASSNL